MNKPIRFTIALLVGLSTAGGMAFGRGFGGGGFHGGGFGGGGFGGGGYHGGGFDGGYRGGFDGGGFRSDGFDNRGFENRGFDDGGFRSDGFGGQGYRTGNFDAGRYGQAPSRNQVDSFLGLPTDGGMHAAGNVYRGADGVTVAHGVAGERGFAAGPNGVAAGGRVAGGTAVEGPRGNVAARGFAAGRGVVAGRGFAGTHYFSPTYFHAQGVNARRWYGNHPYFTAGWIGNHPWAWTPFGYGAGAWASAAWTAASWSSVGLWLGMTASPAYYYYGSNVVYDDGNVYYGDQPLATTDEYYQQASDLVGAGASVPSEDPNWLPLGVFGVVEGNEQQPSSTMQLAVDKQGNVRGNFVDDKSETVLPIQGAVNKKSQRVAWTVGDDKTTVYETGLSNLTEAEAPALVHYGRENTQQCLLVRLTQPDQSPAPQPQQN